MQSGGAKKRKTPAEKQDALRQAAEQSVRRLLEARQERFSFQSSPAVLVDASAASHQVTAALRKDARVQLRGAEGLAGHYFLPRSKTVIVLLGFDVRSSGGSFGSMEAELHQSLMQQQHFDDALQQVRTVATSHAAAANRPVALVMSNLELYKFLSVQCIELDACILPCYGPDEAVEHIARLASDISRQTATEHYDSETRAVTSGPIVDARISALFPSIPAHLRLSGDDLYDLLAGRTSDAICQEHFGWSTAVARTVQSAIQNDSVEP